MDLGRTDRSIRNCQLNKMDKLLVLLDVLHTSWLIARLQAQWHGDWGAYQTGENHDLEKVCHSF